MNYPNGIKNTKDNINSHEVNYKNRGMTLENDINLSNEYYREINRAYIYKKPTPIKITKVSYPSRDKAVIKEAFFTVPSTTDYNGLYKGKYIDFEAKETKNINDNQGIAFLIVRFTTLNETYLLTAEDFFSYLENSNKKSIPISYFREKAYLLEDYYQPRIDYLKIVDHIIGGI